MQQTLVLLRPDAIQRRICGEIIADLEKEGRICAAKYIQMTRELMHEHYAHIVGKPFYDEFETYMLSGPCLALVFEGEDVIAAIRRRIGSLDEPDTIRGRFARSLSFNVIHGSDSFESAEQEMKRFFEEKELVHCA